MLVPFTTAQTRLIRRAASDRVDLLLVQASSAQSVPLAAARDRPESCAPVTAPTSARMILLCSPSKISSILPKRSPVC